MLFQNWPHINDNYGQLPTEVPDTLPELISNDLGYVLPALMNRVPCQLKRELKQIGKQIGGLSKAVHWNLHYELFGGGCVSAAIPGDDGYVFHRRLEWDVGFAPHFRFLDMGIHGSGVRYTPGYVGTLSGFTRDWHIAMNAYPDIEDISSALGNPARIPASWVLRSAIARNGTFDETIEHLLSRRVARSAFVILASKTQACWVVLDPSRSRIERMVRFPEPLVVLNNWNHANSLDDQDWLNCTDEAYQADDPEDWVLDQYVKPIGV